MVFIDKLSKMIHICPCAKLIIAPQLAQLYLDAIFAQHGLSKTIITNWGTQFTSLFSKTLFGFLNIKFAMSMAYHPQTDGQTERANRTIEDMLRAFTLEEQAEWDTLLPLVEFSYNNSLNASIKVTPFYLIYKKYQLTLSSFIKTPNAPEDYTKIEVLND